MDATFLAAQGAFTLEDLTPALLVGSLVLLWMMVAKPVPNCAPNPRPTTQSR